MELKVPVPICHITGDKSRLINNEDIFGFGSACQVLNLAEAKSCKTVNRDCPGIETSQIPSCLCINTDNDCVIEADQSSRNGCDVVVDSSADIDIRCRIAVVIDNRKGDGEASQFIGSICRQCSR